MALPPDRLGQRGLQKKNGKPPLRGLSVNTGNGPKFQPIDIKHPEYVGIIEPDTAFWSLVRRDRLAEALTDGRLLRAWKKKAALFSGEMEMLRFGLTPSAVYFNPTERCNLNCPYCYIPEKMRRHGRHMSEKKLLKALGLLKAYFKRTMSKGALPQVIFHGAEPLLNRDAVFAGIERFEGDFLFGIQTNATLLDDAAVEFLTGRGVSIGISLDAPGAAVSNRTRMDWRGEGVHKSVVEAMERLRGYEHWSVICTITRENMRHLTRLVEFFHKSEVPTCLMNIVRCTLPSSQGVKPTDAAASRHFLKALDRTYELYRETGRKLPVGNFANILLAIIAPTARRLMCDISPCGGGRCFFALTPGGDLFPCSEFIGLKSFKGGNLFRDDMEAVLESPAFRMVTGRKVEDIEPCGSCAIRHFCGAPCPAEAHEMNGGMDKLGAFCEFYEEQVSYAFRLIADNKHEAFLWDGWDKGTKTTLAPGVL
jgi:uncharacterized protein